jgi:hypothetical protein
MLKLHVLTLISLTLAMVAVGCSSSDQAAIDKSISAGLAADQTVIASPTATPTPEPPPTSTTEAVTDPFIPTIYDAKAAFSTSLTLSTVAYSSKSEEEEIDEIIHSHFTGRWLLHLLSRNEVGSRKEFQSFVDQGDDFLFDYKLNRAMQRIDIGDLPDWAHDYFVEPTDEEHALVACTAYFFTVKNPGFWASMGHDMCEKQMIRRLQDGGTESWTEWLINVPNPF